MPEDNLVSHALMSLRLILDPAEWSVRDADARPGPARAAGYDVLLTAEGPDGRSVLLGIEAKPSANAQMVLSQLATYRDAAPEVIPLLFVWRITRRVAEVCVAEGVCFLDGFGAARLKWRGLYIEKSPQDEPLVPPDGQLRLWIESRLPGLPEDIGDLLSMRAPLRQHVARVLLSEPNRAWSISDLAQEAKVSLPTASKVVKVLEEQVVVRRDADRSVRVSAPAALLGEWSSAWRLGAKGRRGYYCLGRNIDEVIETLTRAAETAGAKLALTLAAGAAYYGSHLRDDLVHAYVMGPETKLAEAAGMTTAPSGANVILYEPPDEGVFYMPQSVALALPATGDEAVLPVCPVQLCLDMVGAGGRYAEEARTLREEVLGY